jgi:hypothetical protein
MKLTNLERLFVENMVTNDYGEAPQHCIWSSAWTEGVHGSFCAPEQITGVIASLVNKGIVSRKEHPEWEREFQSSLQFTETGQEIVRKLQDAENI